jgi:SSS family solute:Na+ symporter
MLIYEIQAWVVLILGWVFLPFYARAGVFTMPEFLEKRFDARSRWILSVFSIVAYVLTKISVTIYAGGVVVSALLGIDFWTGAIATVVLTGVYTVLGGMRAVVYTETLQAIILIIGAAALTVIGLEHVGGWESMKETVTPEYLNMWRSASDPDFPWPSLLITSTIVGIWYWCTDQYIVQRALTAKNIKEGRRAFRIKGIGGRRSLGSLDEFVGLCVQFVFNIVHGGYLQKATAQYSREKTGENRSDCYGDRGDHRYYLDSYHGQYFWSAL